MATIIQSTCARPCRRSRRNNRATFSLVKPENESGKRQKKLLKHVGRGELQNLNYFNLLRCPTDSNRSMEFQGLVAGLSHRSEAGHREP